MGLVDALAADGLVAVVGAGGKKSTLYALAERLDRAVVTATVRIPIFDPNVAEVTVTDDPVTTLEHAFDDPERFPLGLVPEREDDRYHGYDPETVALLAQRSEADAVLVKADGARAREFKAPGENEPRIPRTADTVIPVVSAHVEGQPLTDEHVHRPERVADLTGLSAGERIEAGDVATVLTSPEGGLKGVPEGATVVPVVNKVDDAADEAAANRIGNRLVDHDRIDGVALTRLAAPDDPLVSVLY
jgi:probable selenium-dependent hydroxylase accessory protein YqeC